ncbi:hypothetical protein COX09_04620 [Candidatus Beckwithbacteria bacterium CG23_combo_of_CG06-09_8_20_14_all_47_9]|uniref:Uncharacterized protein n=2 Tax=Candidatus Beckwithiibacteriota TaxID=1752726 RepID=A0A2H0B2N6_9BACT|nr:MAG: hypothetical protein COX09_04620 [Candidatus Beckwithbacteria bacterium CG23_combo_of_CG06-09_8_20_14_all_47_9]
MAQIDPQVQTLVDDYIDCLQSKAAADEAVQAAKQKLLDYSQSVKKKTIFYSAGSVTVSVKNRTVFPRLNQPGRKELEQAVKAGGWWDKTLSFDVIKLADAYDNRRLPADLAGRLKPLAKSERQVRIFVNESTS